MMTNGAQSIAKPLTVLLSSVGRRSQLVSCFRQAFEKLGVEGRIIGCDSNPTYAPAAYLVDQCHEVTRCNDPSFLEDVLSLAKAHNVSLIVPTIDPELPLYASAREMFRAEGIQVAISGPKTVQIAGDKVETNTWLNSHGIPTVCQASAQQVMADLERWPLPVIVKPRRGSASVGVMKITSHEMLQAVVSLNPELLIEECATGEEHTINVFVNALRQCVCTVPHRRIETRGGEVSKGVTAKNPALMQLAKTIVDALPDAFGALNIQCFLNEQGIVRVTEINARFGGGFPLANEAGATFPLWLLQEILGIPSPSEYDAWTDQLTMLRYDSSVFFKVGAHD
jgi:carbamoyl-phosphate synthase large subunit